MMKSNGWSASGLVELRRQHLEDLLHHVAEGVLTPCGRKLGIKALSAKIWWRESDAVESLPEIGTSQMGLSENSVPLHPMVNDHYPY